LNARSYQGGIYPIRTFSTLPVHR